MADLLVDIAGQFNTRMTVKIRMIFKLAFKDIFNKLQIYILSDNHWKKIPTNFVDLFPNLRNMRVYNDWITDAHIIRLKKSLTSLSLSPDCNNKGITDVSISQLDLRLLTQNSIINSNITEKSVVLNKKMQVLSITPYIDPEIAIKELKHLKGLGFVSTPSNHNFTIPESIYDIEIQMCNINLSWPMMYHGHKTIAFILPYEHADFLNCPKFLHYMVLGITYRYINRFEWNETYFKSLKLNYLKIYATQKQDKRITKEWLIDLLKFFSVDNISRIFIYLDDELIYKNR